MGCYAVIAWMLVEACKRARAMRFLGCGLDGGVDMLQRRHGVCLD